MSSHRKKQHMDISCRSFPIARFAIWRKKPNLSFNRDMFSESFWNRVAISIKSACDSIWFRAITFLTAVIIVLSQVVFSQQCIQVAFIKMKIPFLPFFKSRVSFSWLILQVTVQNKRTVASSAQEKSAVPAVWRLQVKLWWVDPDWTPIWPIWNSGLI